MMYYHQLLKWDMSAFQCIACPVVHYWCMNIPGFWQISWSFWSSISSMPSVNTHSLNVIYGHLNFLLPSPQCTQKFHLHLPKVKIEVQTTYTHLWVLVSILLYLCARPKGDIFLAQWWWKVKTSILLLVHVVRVIKSHWYLQSQNPSCTTKGEGQDFFPM